MFRALPLLGFSPLSNSLGVASSTTRRDSSTCVMIIARVRETRPAAVLSDSRSVETVYSRHLS